MISGTRSSALATAGAAFAAIAPRRGGAFRTRCAWLALLLLPLEYESCALVAGRDAQRLAEETRVEPSSRLVTERAEWHRVRHAHPVARGKIALIEQETDAARLVRRGGGGGA